MQQDSYIDYSPNDLQHADALLVAEKPGIGQRLYDWILYGTPTKKEPSVKETESPASMPF